MLWTDPATDFALLKIDYAANAKKEFLKGIDGFPFLKVSERELEEGEPVYAFGYPLPVLNHFQATEVGFFGSVGLSPRTTSAIVASQIEHTKMFSATSDAKVYVLDKALNYGNSGGPILSVETGHVHAICSRFQPVTIRQEHFKKFGIAPPEINVPSLYGIVSSLSNARIVSALKKKRVEVSAL